MNFYKTFSASLLLIINTLDSGHSADSGVCYGSLGCFNITNDFKSLIYRPINLLPESPERIDTKFIHFSRNNRKTGKNFDRKWFTSDKFSDKLGEFDGSKEAKFIIHGYLDNLDVGKWMLTLKDELLTKGDFNVFIVDWSSGNGMPYSQASANCRVVGSQIALLLRNLNRNSQLKYNLVHLIGHSLGAHLAGYAGAELYKSTKNKLGRISALDPAEPYFQNMPTTVRLDRKDADFVDVLHTDSKSILQFGLGMSQAIGHMDFYPNGGNDQPGCNDDRVKSILSGDLADGTRKLVACNHDRAIQYFIESVNEGKGCVFSAYSCDSWSSFNLKNRCNTCGKSGSFCSEMGFNAIKWKRFKSDKKSKKFYLRTNSDKPFCVIQLKIEIPVKSIGKESDIYHGRFKLKMTSGSNITYAYIDSLDISGNDSYYSVITVKDINFFSSLDSIDFEWFEETFDVFNPNTWKLNSLFNQSTDRNDRIDAKQVFINQINIKPLFLGTESQMKTKKFCNKTPNSGIKPEKSVIFRNC